MSQESQTRITVQVQPGAGQSKVVSFTSNILQVKIAAPPVKGRANKELMGFLSGLLGVSKSSINIEKGMTSRRKLIAISGLTQAQVLERLGLG